MRHAAAKSWQAPLSYSTIRIHSRLVYMTADYLKREEGNRFCVALCNIFATNESEFALIEKES